MILGADLFDTQTAERYGWINRALPAADLDGFIARLAHNIASLPDGAIRAAKRAIPAAALADGLQRESQEWFQLVTQPTTGRLIGGGLTQRLQTTAGERRLESLLRSQLQ